MVSRGTGLLAYPDRVRIGEDVFVGELRLADTVRTDLSRHSRSDLDAVAAALNALPRKTLGWRTPAEALNEHLHSLQQGSVATTP